MKRSWAIFLLGTVGAFLVGLWLLPHAVTALPGEVRARLPEGLVRVVTTPLPTALPTAAAQSAPVQVTLPSFATATPSPTSSPTPHAETATPSPAGSDSAPTVTATTAPTSSPTPTAVPQRQMLEGLEITPQKLNNCGPTTLSINLQYYGVERTQFDVAGVVKPNYEDRNVSPEELVDYVNQHTPLRAALYSGGSLGQIKRLIAAGFPVVIEKGYEPSDWQGWMGHYLTVYGYDDGAGVFWTMDTFLGPWDNSGKAYTYEETAAYWQHFNNTFFVVYAPQQEAMMQAVVDPALQKPLTMWQQAATQAQADLGQEPENAFAWFNLGTSLAQLGSLTREQGYFEQAALAFDNARVHGLPPRMLWYQFQPYVAYLAAGRTDEVMTLTSVILDNVGGRNVEETHFYRGLVLEQNGDTGAAERAYRTALRLKPGYDEAQTALDGLLGRGNEQMPTPASSE